MALSLGGASLLSSATPAPRRLLHWNHPHPSNSAPECPNHATEEVDHNDPLPDIVHHHIENGGGEPVPRMIYGENTKALE